MKGSSMIDNFDLALKKDLDIVEKRLEEALATDQPLLIELTRYFCQVKGKRLRPLVVLLSGRLGQAEQEKLVSLAAAVEILHMATLVHDDIVDDAVFRRGREALHRKWGQGAGLLLGDYFYAKSMRLLSKSFPTAIREVIYAAEEMVEGEMEEQQHSFNLDISEDQYIRRIRKKTASLIRACCLIGAHAGGGRGKKLRALGEYGEALGIAFQIRDDYLDYCGREQHVGKPVGKDFCQGVITLPLIQYLKSIQAGDREKAEILRLMGKDKDFDDEEWTELISAMRKKGALDYTMQMGNQYVKKALQRLEELPDSPIKDTLKEIANFALIRNH